MSTSQGKPKKIIITGGAGFLGANLCRRLHNEGHHIIAIDNLKTGRLVNIEDLATRERFDFINEDITDPLDLKLEADEIYNLACPASPPHYQSDPIGTTKTCVLGSIHMLELARSTGAKIFQASTSEVYGDPDIHPQPETYRGSVNPIGPRACYDEGKRAAESLFFDYHRVHGVEIKVARIFNTYGPGMDPADGRVVSNFIVQALAGEEITIYGDGSQTRSFCYVDDLIEGFIRLMNTPKEITGPVNLGNPGEFTIAQLAEKVTDLIPGGSKVGYRPIPTDDPKQRRPDITLAKELLGWEPSVSLEEGLRKTIPWFEKNLAG